MTVTRAASAFGVLMWPMSSGAIWIAGIYISALHALNVKTVDTNICWLFPANVATFVHHAIRNGWWNSANGYAQRCSNMCRTGSGFSVFPNGCESISCSIAVFWQNWVAAHGRYWTYIWPKPSLNDAKAGAAIAVQSFGDFQNFSLHLHVWSPIAAFIVLNKRIFINHLNGTKIQWLLIFGLTLKWSLIADSCWDCRKTLKLWI